ncbi:MAG: RNA-directed DNA polymerase, partial [Proteobacteria bacterium]
MSMPIAGEDEMPVVDKNTMELAIKNIATHGDTDIFPFPAENHLLHDKPQELVGVLMEVDKKFKEFITSIPVLTSKNLSAVGYSGFRYGTQIDPLWNTYLLALVLTVADDLEKKRVSNSIVFSYRYAPDSNTGSLFDKSVGWHEFQTTAIKHAKEFPYILRCDISDFYPRIYHHRLENAIKSATSKGDATLRILELISAIAEGPSYGLPVGGAAARILSETLLNRVDRLLISEQIRFCRFVDDYIIFAESKEAAHSALIKLSSLLLSNEGLSLQKTKTRILSAAEFLATSEFSDPSEDESSEEQVSRTFRRLRVHFDPYSP